jgi:sec-independent protein translocase protein TatA
MFSDLFDSPWKILIIAAVVMVLFGAKKMPDAARSLGKSMRILKTEMQGMNNDEEHSSPFAPGSAEPAPPQQITSSTKTVEERLAELENAAMRATPASDAQHQNQPS